MSENMELADSPTPECSRRYIQWKEAEIGLLLDNLEQTDNYKKWKANKTGYAKQVSEEVFKNNITYEAIKFKIRWLETRFNSWHDILNKEQDETNKVDIQEKMRKEFPYYQRCKEIFETDTLLYVVKPKRKRRFIDAAPAIIKKTRESQEQPTESDRNKIRVMEIELEHRRMSHLERMQEMKLEQLKLEVELEKLKH